MRKDKFFEYFKSEWDIRHFGPNEVIENTGEVPPEDLWDNILPTLKVADQMRQDWGRPLTVVSGYRSIEYNKKAKGVDNSTHIDFNALDLKCYAIDDPKVFVAWAVEWKKKFGRKPDNLPVVHGVRRTYTPNKAHKGKREPSTYGKTLRHGIYGSADNREFIHIDTAPIMGSRWYHWDDEEGGRAEIRQIDHDPANPGQPVVTQESITVDTTSPPKQTIKKDEKNEPEEKSHTVETGGDSVIFRNDEKIDGTPFTIQEYLTPEELRRGIIPQVFQSNDWHLHAVDDEEGEDRVSGTVDEIEASSDSEKTTGAGRELNPRQRYVASIVQAEFYRRRYASRSVPTISGPFNPYPVPGFPGLILDPARPMIAQIKSVTHTIRVEGGQARTAIAFQAPRYWDEGEVWYHMGGWSREDLQKVRGTSVNEDDYAILYRRYPQWHNNKTVATNNYTSEQDYKEQKNRRTTELDRYYLFMLGTEAVDYMSNHWNKADNPNKIARSIRDRTPADLEVSPQTLDIREYNRMIAETTDDGRYAPWTLANHFWGDIRPHADIDAKYPIDSAMEYAERYGVRERELMVEFLDNKARRTDSGHMVYTGPTFGSEDVNPLQKLILEYIDELEQRDVGGGTT